MTKDEARLSVMGAISMALKDSTLQQGFEIICKNLSELEKENAELKAKNKWYAEQVCNKECAEVWGNLTKAKAIIQSMLSLMPSGYNDMGNCDFIWEVRDEAEQFLKE